MSAQILTGFPKRLVAKGWLSDEQAHDAIAKSRAAKSPLVHYLVEKQLVKPVDAALAASEL